MTEDLDDYRALVEGNAIATPFRGRIEVRGNDRAIWLNNLCTADIKSLKPGECREAFCTNVKGHVLAHVLVVATDVCLLLYSLADDLVALIPQLDRYIIREDVSLVDTSSEAGPWLAADGCSIEAEQLTHTSAFGISLGVYDALNVTAREALANRIAAAGLPIATHETFETVRIAAGWPLHGIDFGDGALPQELSRTEQAISFTKGCYLGQETVARLDALGHVNKQIARVNINSDEPPSLPAPLLAVDKPAGTLTSVAQSPHGNGWIGLAMVKRAYAMAGTELRVQGGVLVTVE